MPKAHRIEAGRAYCLSCYARVFERDACSSCGKACVAKKFDPRPLCRACATSERRCVRCHRPVPRAGIRVGAGFVCASCTPHYREKRPCPNCGTPSSRLTRLEGMGEPICPRCARKATHAACAACGRHRRIGAVNSHGRLVCISCTGPEPATHACPDCGGAVAGSGLAPCRTCAARRRGRAAIMAEAPKIGWPRALFERFCEEKLVAAPRGRVAREVEKAAMFFQTLGRKIPSEDRLEARALQKAFGAESLRRFQNAVSFLTGVTKSEITDSERRALVEQDRIERLFDEIQERPWAGDIKAYDHALRAKAPDIAARSRRLYLRAAVGLLELADCLRLQDMTQADLEAFLRRRPGQRASLAPLLRWIGERHGTRLKLPQGRKKDAARREKKFLADVTQIMEDLKAARDAARAKALIATAISRLYRIPLERVLTLSASDVFINDDILLWPKQEAIRLEKPLADTFQRWIPVAERLLAFPGRNPRRPISVSAIAHAAQSQSA